MEFEWESVASTGMGARSLEGFEWGLRMGFELDTGAGLLLLFEWESVASLLPEWELLLLLRMEASIGGGSFCCCCE